MNLTFRIKQSLGLPKYTFLISIIYRSFLLRTKFPQKTNHSNRTQKVDQGRP